MPCPLLSPAVCLHPVPGCIAIHQPHNCLRVCVQGMAPGGGQGRVPEATCSAGGPDRGGAHCHAHASAPSARRLGPPAGVPAHDPPPHITAYAEPFNAILRTCKKPWQAGIVSSPTCLGLSEQQHSSTGSEAIFLTEVRARYIHLRSVPGSKMLSACRGSSLTEGTW